MKNIKSYFLFSNEQRKGIFLLLLIIIFFQVSWFFYDFAQSTTKVPSSDEKKWIANQSKIENLKLQPSNNNYKIYPFNPNFITDYKGYKLGMSVTEIDRLLAFRKKGKYVNSAQEFQNITKVSDSLLRTMSSYFKFPDWVKNKKESVGYVNYDKKAFDKKDKKQLLDINQATQEDLVKIYGIGEVISLRILKFKESLGGFVSMEQMKDIWGLSPEVIESLNANFKINSLPSVKKIHINNASLKEIGQFPYFRYPLSKEILVYRSMNGDFKKASDLTKIKGMSIEKANIIALYLAF